jgi:hypothetical protein
MLYANVQDKATIMIREEADYKHNMSLQLYELRRLRLYQCLVS